MKSFNAPAQTQLGLQYWYDDTETNTTHAPETGAAP